MPVNFIIVQFDVNQTNGLPLTMTTVSATGLRENQLESNALLPSGYLIVKSVLHYLSVECLLYDQTQQR